MLTLKKNLCSLPALALCAVAALVFAVPAEVAAQLTTPTISVEDELNGVATTAGTYVKWAVGLGVVIVAAMAVIMYARRGTSGS